MSASHADHNSSSGKSAVDNINISPYHRPVSPPVFYIPTLTQQRGRSVGGLDVIFVRYQVFDQLPVAGYAPGGYLLKIIDSTHRYIMSEYEESLEHCLNYTGRVGSV